MQGEWIRTGTIDAENGSATIIGNATAWRFAGVLVGDFFVGPDERFYEITTVYLAGEDGPGPNESERIEVRSISGIDAYSGSTVTGSNYAIIRNWSNTTNSVLAAKIADLLETSAILQGGGLIKFGTGDPPTGDFNDGVLYVKY